MTAKAMTDMYERAYWEIQEVLDEALGTGDEDGAGMGIVADVRLLAQRYAQLKAAALGVRPPAEPAHWKRTVELIESTQLLCQHMVPVDDDCRDCIAKVVAQIEAARTQP